MKLTCIVAIFFALAVVTTANEGRKKAHEKCQSNPDTHIDESVLEKLRNNEEVDEVQLGKHTLCMHLEWGIQDANGDINEDKFKSGLKDVLGDDDKVNDVVSKCGHRASGTPEEAANALEKCLIQNGVGGGHHHH